MAPDNHVLWSEATEVIDFGEGTKVRIKNTTVTLKGKFFRNNSSHLKNLEGFKIANEEAHEYLDRSKVDGQWHADHRLIKRIAVLVGARNHEHSENTKLIGMVAQRDTTIEMLKKQAEKLGDIFIDTAKAHLFTAIEAVSDFRRKHS